MLTLLFDWIQSSLDLILNFLIRCREMMMGTQKQQYEEKLKWVYQMAKSATYATVFSSVTMGVISPLLCEEVPLGEVTWQNQKSVPYNFFPGL
jgi:hypothetical protein